MNTCKYEVSVIVPVSERHDEIAELHAAYSEAINAAGFIPSFVYVLDGTFEKARSDLEKLRSQGQPVRIVQLRKHFGEATALSAGFEQSQSEWVLTLPAYYQVEPSSIGRLFDQVPQVDLVLGRRWPRTDSRMNQILTRLFHGLVGFLTNLKFRDLGSGVRLFRRKVVDEVPIYGDQHRFFPILAAGRGFKILEVDLPQSKKEAYHRVPELGVIPRRLLDLISVFFLVKFTKKPLRFFGLIGSATLGVSLIALTVLIVQRFFYQMPLADRPALLLASLLAVLGVQLLAIGLVGEIVIFTHASQMKEYTIEEIVGANGDDGE